MGGHGLQLFEYKAKRNRGYSIVGILFPGVSGSADPRQDGQRAHCLWPIHHSLSSMTRGEGLAVIRQAVQATEGSRFIFAME